jgi:hypothetical protein
MGECVAWLSATRGVSLIVLALAVGGILLWRRTPRGVAISAVAGIQGALYLFVLSVNAADFGSAHASSRMSSPPIAVAGCIHDT